MLKTCRFPATLAPALGFERAHSKPSAGKAWCFVAVLRERQTEAAELSEDMAE